MVSSSKPCSRWFQFSLRVLFLVVTIAAVLLACVGSRLYRSQEQRNAIGKIIKARASVMYDYQSSGVGLQASYDPSLPMPGPKWIRNVTGDDFFRKPVGVVFFESATAVPVSELVQLDSLRFLSINGTAVLDADLQQLTTLKDLQSLYLRHTKVTDSAITSLQRLPKLRVLQLGSTAISDDGCRQLGRLRGLERLYVSNTEITDAGIRHLCDLSELNELALSYTGVTDTGLISVGKLQKLRSLWLTGTQITDDGLVYLSHLSHLHLVNLRYTKITGTGFRNLTHLRLRQVSLESSSFGDAGLRELAHCSSLKEVGLSNSQVTDRGVANLRRALPNCRIHYTPRMFGSSKKKKGTQE